MRRVKDLALAAVIVAIGALATGGVAQAQDEGAAPSDSGGGHGGFYLRLGLGFGYYSASADDVSGDANFSGLTIPLELLMGGTLFDGFVLGGGVSVDYAPSPTYEVNGVEPLGGFDFSQYVVSLGAFADYYFLGVDEGLHGQLRVGWGGLETSAEGNVGGSDPTGLMLTLGGGYDYWVAGSLGVGGLVRLTYAPLSQNSVDVSTIALGLVGSLTWY